MFTLKVNVQTRTLPTHDIIRGMQILSSFKCSYKGSILFVMKEMGSSLYTECSASLVKQQLSKDYMQIVVETSKRPN